ncbi:MAG: peptide chain release factor 1 [candidate division Zixibacteria bacterium]|nr:peptide chain release factor 1 [candidate division Zixibacteria bacterium]
MFLERLIPTEQRYAELDRLLADPSVTSDQEKLRDLGREYHELTPVMHRIRAYRKVLDDIESAQLVLQDDADDTELSALAEAELEELAGERERVEKELIALLVPRDPEDTRNVICEIRAGTGGDEAGIFAGDLYRMYTRYAELKGWRAEVMNSAPAERGGFKEIIFQIEGRDVYGRLKHESGVHRVQRVPQTETQGRIHTSAASVVILPEAEDVEVFIDPKDLEIDVYRSTGPGGQSVNTTDSAVRITHRPSGLIVTCQDEKSQHKNKAKALKVLRARLFDMARQEQEARLSDMRRSQVRSGDRSEKIRTYNFPQGRVTDHRIGLTIHRIEQIMQGEIDEIAEALAQAEQAEKIDRIAEREPVSS